MSGVPVDPADPRFDPSKLRWDPGPPEEWRPFQAHRWRGELPSLPGYEHPVGWPRSEPHIVVPCPGCGLIHWHHTTEYVVQAPCDLGPLGWYIIRYVGPLDWEDWYELLVHQEDVREAILRAQGLAA